MMGASDMREQTERAGTVQPAEDKAQRDLICMYTYLMWGGKEDEVRYFSVVRTIHNRHKGKYRKIGLVWFGLACCLLALLWEWSYSGTGCLERLCICLLADI